jgi:hypothetical protein
MDDFQDVPFLGRGATPKIVQGKLFTATGATFRISRLWSSDGKLITKREKKRWSKSERKKSI